MWVCGQTADELNARIAALEVKNESELGSLRSAAHGAREALLRATAANTAGLGEIAGLSERQFKLERELNRSSASVHVGDQVCDRPAALRAGVRACEMRWSWAVENGPFSACACVRA